MANSDAASPREGRLRVILLEDDGLLRERILVPGLRQFGFHVDAIGHPAELEDLVRQQRPDIIVLDVGLPGRSGYDVARDIRASMADVGVIMLTARHEAADQIRGLSEGADAYLSKPVDLDLLAANLHSLARRLQHSSPPTIVPGHWRFGADGWCLISPSGRSVALTQTESRTLRPLLESTNRVVQRDELIAALTADVHGYDPHRLDSIIHRIRKKVMEVLGEPLPIKAVPGQGYVLISS